MNDTNLPQAVYYVMLYALIFVIKFVKVFVLIRRSPKDHTWRHVSFVALEMVNTFAGVVILLVASVSKGWVSVVLIAYAMLLFVSSALDTLGPEIQEKKRVALNLAVVLFVVSATIISFKVFIHGGIYEDDGQREASYAVSLPYIDATLSRHLGAKRNGVISVFTTRVSADSREAALEKALAVFESGQGPSLFDPAAAKNDFNVNLLRSKAVVERLAAREGTRGSEER